jgi:hypothetical protein
MSDTSRRLAPDERMPSNPPVLLDTIHTKAHDTTNTTAHKLAHVTNEPNGQSPTCLASPEPVALTLTEPIPITKLQEALVAGHTTFNTLLANLPNNWKGHNNKGTLVTKHTLTQCK